MHELVTYVASSKHLWLVFPTGPKGCLDFKMLIKEYRIPLPMSVDEYRIAQLYMIQVSL